MTGRRECTELRTAPCAGLQATVRTSSAVRSAGRHPGLRRICSTLLSAPTRKANTGKSPPDGLEARQVRAHHEGPSSQYMTLFSAPVPASSPGNHRGDWACSQQGASAPGSVLLLSLLCCPSTHHTECRRPGGDPTIMPPAEASSSWDYCGGGAVSYRQLPHRVFCGGVCGELRPDPCQQLREFLSAAVFG